MCASTLQKEAGKLKDSMPPTSSLSKKYNRHLFSGLYRPAHNYRFLKLKYFIQFKTKCAGYFQRSGVILAKNPPLRVDLVLNEGGGLWLLGQIWTKFSPPAARFPIGNRHLEAPKRQKFPPAAGFYPLKWAILGLHKVPTCNKHKARRRRKIFGIWDPLNTDFQWGNGPPEAKICPNFGPKPKRPQISDPGFS